MMDFLDQEILPMMLSSVALVLFIVTAIMQIVLNRRYKAFVKLTGDVDVESVLISNQKMISDINSELGKVNNHLEKVDSRLDIAYSRMAITKYDAFDGMGGQLSAVVALLDDHHNGLLLHSIHTREGNHLYTKIIEKGTCSQSLSNEETATLKQAIK